MTPIQNLLSEPPFQALGWALIHFLWQGALVALALAACKYLLRRSTARVRYAVSGLFLLTLLALPVLTFVTAMAPAPSDAAGVNWVQTGAAALLPSHGDAPSLTLSPNFEESVTPLLPWVVGIWIAGVMLLTLRWFAAFAYLRRLRRAVSVPIPPEWERTLQDVKRRIRLSAAIRLSVSTLAQAPSVIGWLRPVVLMPASALAGLDAAALEAVLAHEVAHIRRHDYLVNLLQAVVDTLLFYHPAVWWVSKQIRIERENCCDDIAAEACGDRVIYARALVDLEQSRARYAALALAASGGSLLYRIQRLLRAGETDSRRGPSWLSAAAGVAIIALLLAALHSTAHAKGEQPMDLVVNAEDSPALPQAAEAGSPQAQPAPQAATAPDSQDESPAPEAQPQIASSDAIESSEAPEPQPEPAVPSTKTSESSDAATPQAAQPAIAPSTRAGESSDFLSGMAAVGFRNLTVDQLIDLKTNGVTPEFARSVQQAGYADVKPEQLIKLRQHGVDGRFMQAMKADGLGDLSLDDLIQLRDHGVTPDYIAEMKAAGLSGLKAGQLIELRDHGVDGTYLHGMKAAGFSNLPVTDLVRLRDHGVTPDFIKGITAAGYRNLSADEYQILRDNGVDGAHIRKLNQNGLHNLSVQQLIRLRQAGI